MGRTATVRRKKATMSDRCDVCSSAKSVTVEPGGDDDGVIISEEPVLVVKQKVYDLMDDRLIDRCVY